jgi:hypothetical protein
MFTNIFFAFSCAFSGRYHRQISETSHQNLDRRSITLSNMKQASVIVSKDSHCFIKNTSHHLAQFFCLKPTCHICETEFYMQIHTREISLK